MHAIRILNFGTVFSDLTCTALKHSPDRSAKMRSILAKLALLLVNVWDHVRAGEIELDAASFRRCKQNIDRVRPRKRRRQDLADRSRLGVGGEQLRCVGTTRGMPGNLEVFCEYGKKSHADFFPEGLRRAQLRRADDGFSLPALGPCNALQPREFAAFPLRHPSVWCYSSYSERLRSRVSGRPTPARSRGAL